MGFEADRNINAKEREGNELNIKQMLRVKIKTLDDVLFFFD